jgi:DNA modification methylase
MFRVLSIPGGSMDNKANFVLAVVYQPIVTLLAHPRNARSHSKRQIRQLADSIKVFGFTNPVLIDHKNTIIAGHGRVAAAKSLGMDRVPTIRIENLSENEIKAYMIADNKLAELAGWDKEILAIELQHLMTLDSDLDVTITGFEIAEVDLIVEEATQRQSDRDDRFEIDETIPPVTQPGDLWQLGKHRILAGNSLETSSYRSLMGSRRANIVFADPPYNVPIDGHASGHGAIKHRDFAMASSEMSEVEFVAFLAKSFGLLARFSTTGAVHFICMDWRHIGETHAAGNQVYDEQLNLCVWVKDNGGLGSLYRSQHELIFVFRNGKGPHRNNVRLGQYGRNRTNVWEYAGANTFSRNNEEGNLLALHPTPKPISLVADALLDCSARGDIVLDPFLGSGTTLMAAERVGRVCHGIEIDPVYVDVAIRRWQKHTGDFAIHAATGKRFDAIAAAAEASNA